MAPENYLKVVFQPHRYARLAKYIDEFAKVLREGADEIVVAPVFAAWTESGDVNSANLADAIGEKASLCSSNWSETASAIIAKSVGRKETLAVLGAGDIDGLVKELRICIIG
jgi:UDP-N-acetylmuramate--alanine ligase